MARVMNALKDTFGTQKDESLGHSLERQTAKVPSDVFLWSAMGAVIGSAILQSMRKKEASLFVGQWVPSLLAIGVYNKMMRLMDSKRSN